jgi:hypothetical protein
MFMLVHLFDAETQKDVCRRLTRLCKCAITGRQVGALVPREGSRRSGPAGSKRMNHSPESFSQMWDEVTDGKWKVESATLQTTEDSNNLRQMLTFVVRRNYQK